MKAKLNRALMNEVMDAVGVLQRGMPDLARPTLEALWNRAQDSDQAFIRCTIAHFMADLEKDPASELSWDLRALEAADATRPEDIPGFDSPVDLDAFYPSLHLNAADAALRVGDLELASHHAEQAMARASLLSDEGYGRTIRGGIDRLHQRVTDAFLIRSSPRSAE